MEKPSLAYLHAEDTYQKLCSLAAESTVIIGGFRLDERPSETSSANQLITHGEINGRKARQVLSKSPKSDIYSLTTTFTEWNGEVVHGRIGPNSDIEAVDLASDSFFRQILDAAEAEDTRNDSTAD